MKKILLLSLVLTVLCWSFASAAKTTQPVKAGLSTSSVAPVTQPQITKAAPVVVDQSTASNKEILPEKVLYPNDAKWSMPSNPPTPPVIQDVILSEDFENGGLIPADWTDCCNTTYKWIYNGGTSGNPNPGAPHGGAYAACYNIYSISAGNDTLITPSMNLSIHSGNYVMSFWYWDGVDPYAAEDSVTLWMCDAGVNTYIAKLPQNLDVWTQLSFPFSSTSSDVKFKFGAYSDYGFTDPYLDDFLVIDEGTVLTGRCCYGPDPYNPLCSEGTVEDCNTLGGTFTLGATCADPCQGLPIGDDCSHPIIVNLPADMPYSDLNKTTCGFTDDYNATCLNYYDNGPDVIYQLNITAEVVVSITALGSTPTGGSPYTGIALFAECPPVTCIDSATYYGSVPITMDNLTLVPGTYYLMVDNWAPGPDCMNYNLYITPYTECVVVCPTPNTPEGEPDCYDEYVDGTNGGCNYTPNLFGTITDGETICGTAGTFLYTGSNYRDMDWYEITVAERKMLTVTGQAEFPMVLWIFSGTCAARTTLASASVLPCSTATVSHVVDPGTYMVVAAPSIFTGITCGTPYYITANLTEPPPPPTPDFFVTGPGSFTNPLQTTCGAVDNCDLRAGDDQLWEVTIPDDGIWTFSMCATPLSWDSYMYLSSSVCGTPLTYSDDFCGALSQITFELTAGTYYLDIEGFGTTSCGAYYLDITWAPPCIVTCPDGGIPEVEPNGGCNDDPPNFNTVLPGQTVCGNSWMDGSFRDTDWYTFSLDADQLITLTATANFDYVVGIIVPNSADPCDNTGSLTYYFTGGPCDTTSLQALLPGPGPGIYVLFVSTVQTTIFTDKPYWVTMTAEPPPPPPANDLCDAAIAVTVPSTTSGTTLWATVDSDAPTCGTTITTPGVWYSVPGTGNTMTATLCDPATNFDTKLNVYCYTCETPVCVDGNDDATCTYNSLLSTVTWCSDPTATYRILVHGFSGSGDFVLNVSDDGIPCTGAVACGIPVFGVNPTSVSATVPINGTATQPLTISNTGDAQLTGSAYITISAPAPSPLLRHATPTAASEMSKPPANITKVEVPMPAPNPRTILQGGDNCATAVDLGNTEPVSDVGTTVGYLNDIASFAAAPACWQGTWYEGSNGGPDVFLTWTAPYDSIYTISGCGSTYDQTILIYNNTCPTMPTDADFICGNEDAACSYSLASEVAAIPLTMGQQILIVVGGYSGASGPYTLTISAAVPPPPLPGCPTEGVIVGQNPTLPSEDWAFATSDIDYPYLGYDNFAGLSAEITEVKFYGIQADIAGGWAACNEDPASFQINFYEDAGGMPGPLVQSYDVTATPVLTGQLFSSVYPSYEFDVTLPTPVRIFQGWVSIQGTSGGDACEFAWQNSFGGDSQAIQYQDGAPVLVAYDFALCLIGTNFTPWLSINPTTFDIPAGDHTIMNVDMNAAGLTAGVYNGTVQIGTNEPIGPFHSVPVQMTVIGQGTIHGIAYNVAPPTVLPNVHVVTRDAGNVVVDDQVTGALGTWDILLPPGTYHQHLSKIGFTDADINGIVVVAGGTANVSFNMQLVGGLGCHYVIGDANQSGTFTGLDVTYSVRFFKGGPHPPYSCECTPGNTWYVSGDVNGSCTFSGLDITYMVRYFKGGAAPIPCASCPPVADILIAKPVNGNLQNGGAGQ
jgi:hypothetical protein